MDKQDCTLLDLVPDLNTKDLAENRRQALDIQEYLRENGRENYSLDEVVFIIMLEHYIKVFEKAKSMVAHNKFSIKYKPASETPKISDFLILPSDKK